MHPHNVGVVRLLWQLVAVRKQGLRWNLGCRVKSLGFEVEDCKLKDSVLRV